MKNILNKFELRPTGKYYPAEFRQISASIDETVIPTPIFDACIEMEMRLLVISRYRTNPRGKHHRYQVELNRHRMADYLYGDIIHELHEILACVYDSNQDESIKRIGQLIEDLKEINHD